MLANTLDDNGRVVAFIYTGEVTQVDGSAVFLDVAMMEGSLNTRLLAAGLVDPLFYTTLPVDLTGRLRAVAIQAREQRQIVFTLSA